MPPDGNNATPNPESATPSPAAPNVPGESAPPDPLVTALSERGIDTSQFESPTEALDELVRLAGDYHRSEPYADMGRRVAGDWDKFQEFVGQRGEEPPADSQEPQAPQPQWDWKPPSFDRANVNRFCEVDPQTGRFRLQEHVNPTYARYADEANRYLDWREKAEDQLYSDFPGTVKEIVSSLLPDILPQIQEGIDGTIGEKFTSLYEQRQQQEQADREFRDVQDKLFAKSESGEYLRDPKSGNFTLTPRGKYFQTIYAQEMQRPGATEQSATSAALGQLRVAEQFNFFEAPQNQVTPHEQAGEQRQTFLEEAAAGARPGMERDGTYPQSASEPPQSPNRPPTAKELADEAIREMGG